MNINDLPHFIAIPATPFLLGTPERDLSALAKAYGGTRESYREESPQHTLTLRAFEMAQTPVTNALYATYVAATGARPPTHWRGAQPPAELRDHPVVEVSWHDARAFCGWLSGAADAPPKPATQWLRSVVRRPLSAAYRLPTEAEWELAARGSDGREFPWGDQWDAARANTGSGGPATTTPVGAYPAGASPFGALDMCGNVWEWTSSLDALYPYEPRDGRKKPRAEGRRILRGGCYANPHGYGRCACRFRMTPQVTNAFLGFRLARDI